MAAKFTGHPLFDTADYLEDHSDNHLHPSVPAFLAHLKPDYDTLLLDYEAARQFLLKYSDVPGTFSRFRSEIQRFLNYLWVTSGRTLAQADEDTVSAYFRTLRQPPKSWISDGIYSAFVDLDGLRQPNPKWRPFVIRSTQKNATYFASEASLKASRTALTAFFKHLKGKRYTADNPVTELRKRDTKSQDPLATHEDREVRRLTDWQWSYLLETLLAAADETPKYERHLFVVVTMKSLFLRVSELAPRPHGDGQYRTPTFGDFKRKVLQGDEYWSYSVFSKGEKGRSVTLPDAYLPYLKRWRRHLGLTSALPTQGENHPILPSSHGGALGKRQVQRLYEKAVELTVTRMYDEGFKDESKQLEAIKTETHYLRHTGASQAIEAGADIRHISEELGHASAAFTESVYVNADQAQRRSQGRKRRV